MVCEQLELSASSKPWVFGACDRGRSPDQGGFPGRQDIDKVAGEVAVPGGQSLTQGGTCGLGMMKLTCSGRN